jgi:hypothetical protein
MKTLTFKVTDEEARVIRALAKQEELSLSEFLRRRSGASAVASESPRRMICPHTGATIFAPLPSHPPLTTHEVRQLLSDYP